MLLSLFTIRAEGVGGERERALKMDAQVRLVRVQHKAQSKQAGGKSPTNPQVSYFIRSRSVWTWSWSVEATFATLFRMCFKRFPSASPAIGRGGRPIAKRLPHRSRWCHRFGIPSNQSLFPLAEPLRDASHSCPDTLWSSYVTALREWKDINMFFFFFKSTVMSLCLVKVIVNCSLQTEMQFYSVDSERW